MLAEIVGVSGYRSQWHNEIHCFLNARGAACTVCVVRMYANNILYVLHAFLRYSHYKSLFDNDIQFFIQMCACTRFHWVELGTDSSDGFSSGRC